MSGKMMDDIVRMAFITKFNFRDFPFISRTFILSV